MDRFFHASRGLITFGMMLLAAGCPEPLDATTSAPGMTVKDQSFRTPKKAIKKKPAPSNKKEPNKLAKHFPCRQKKCDESYRTFSVRHQAHSKQIGRSAVLSWFKKHKKKEAPASLAMDAATLKNEIANAMNIQFLLDDIATKREVTSVYRRVEKDHHAEILQIVDPHVGRFDVLILTPKINANGHGILALHGHGDTPLKMAQNYLGYDLVRSGFVVVIPRLRVFDCYRKDTSENDVAIELWANGFSLMGLHIYEALLTQYEVNQRPKYNIDRWGILGHSGGSSTTVTLSRLGATFDAIVVDHQVDFNNACGRKGIHCETFGPLFKLAKTINNLETLPVDHLLVPYKYGKQKKDIVPFFLNTLKNK